jgi:hypothetical protein
MSLYTTPDFPFSAFKNVVSPALLRTTATATTFSLHPPLTIRSEPPRPLSLHTPRTLHISVKPNRHACQGTVREYKSQTCKSITWLVDTAVKHGSPHRVSRSQQPDTPVHRIPTEKLSNHATFLGDLVFTIPMPLRIRKAFQGAISGRKKNAKRFQDDFLVQESNKSDAYFVKVLNRSTSSSRR